MQTQMQVLDQVVVFQVNVSQWSGRRRLQATDIRGDAELPPEDLASLGSLKVADPNDLAPFQRIKTAAQRVCGKVGLKFLGGFAVPVAKADEVAKELADLGIKFENEKDSFKFDYQARMNNWIDAHAGWDSEIRRALLDADDAMRRFNFGWTAYKVVAAGQDETAAISTNLKQAAGGLVGQLWEEVAEAAQNLIDKSILGRDKANGKILLPVKALHSKLEGLAFLDPVVKPIMETIESVIASLPPGQPIEGHKLSMLYGLMLILSNPEKAKAHSLAVMAGNQIMDLIDEAIPESRKVVALPPAIEVDAAATAPISNLDIFSFGLPAPSPVDPAFGTVMPSAFSVATGFQIPTESVWF